jgi:selenoprotein W-related protein
VPRQPALARADRGAPFREDEPVSRWRQKRSSSTEAERIATTGGLDRTSDDDAGAARPGRSSPRVEIEYCTQCRWLPRAAWLAQELLGTFGHDLREVALVPGTGGVFVVRVNGTVVWDRRTHGFPEPSAVKRAVRDRVAPEKDLGHAER